MKKFFLTLLGLLVVALVAVVVVPSVIDWNGYRGEIAQRVKDATGRDLIIDGDITMTVLPKPAITVHRVGFGNIKGAESAEMARLESLEVRIALVPLLSGTIQVETVRLVKPVIKLQKFADWRANWQITPATSKDDAATAAPAPSASTSAPSIAVDNFSIVDGTVEFFDAGSGTRERVDAINATFAAASLSGPFESNGGLTVRAMPVTYGLNVGEIIQGRTVPFNLRLNAAGDAGKVQVVGTLLGLEDTPRFKGKIKADGKDLAVMLAQVTGAPPPPVLAQPFSIEAEVAASTALLEIAGIQAMLGTVQANGDVTAEFGKTINAAVQMSVGKVDLDALLAPPPVVKTAATGTIATPPAKPAPAKPSAPIDPSAPLFELPDIALPKNVSASLVANIEAINVNGGLVRNTILNAELANGEVTLSQLSAQLPGGADVALFGFLSNIAGKPRFEGELEATVGDLRATAAWLGSDMKGVPGDRLRKVSLAAELDVRPAETKVNKLDVSFDGSRLTGGLVLAHRVRPAIGVGVTLDRIDLDAYMGGDAPAAGAAPANPFEALQALTRFDANIKAAVKSLTIRGVAARDVFLDVVLHNGNLNINGFSVADYAGAAATISGGIKGLAGVPEAEKLRLAVSAKNSTGLFKVAGITPPVSPKVLGAVAINATLDGSLLKPRVNSTLKAAGGQVNAAGRISILPVNDMIDLKIDAGHADALSVIKLFDSQYRPTSGIGGLRLQAHVTGNPAALDFEGLKAGIGALDASGTARLALNAARPLITADLVTSPLNLNPFMPAQKSAAVAPRAAPSIVPVAYRPERSRDSVGSTRLLRRVATTKNARFPTDPIDLSALGLFDADFKIKAPSIRYQDYQVDKADLKARVSAGKLLLDNLTGTMFGGTVAAKGSLDAKASNALASVINVVGIDIASAMRAATGKADAKGKMTLDLDLGGSVISVRKLVETLAGKGALKMTGVDVDKGAGGSVLVGALSAVTALNQLGGLVGGGRKGAGLADIGATFAIDRGIIATQDLTMTSNFGNGQAKGTVDLPKWQMDIAGQIDMAPDLVSALLSSQSKREPVKFAVKGSLDNPNVKVDTARLAIGVVPGANKLLDKISPKAGGLIQGILGGAAPKAPAPKSTTPAPAPQPQQQQTPEQKVEEEIKKGLNTLKKLLPF